MQALPELTPLQAPMAPAPVLQPLGDRIAHAWQVLHTVLDPEVPAVSLCDLGIVRDVRLPEGQPLDGGMLEIVLTPTYSGCPATEAIESDVPAAINAAGLGPARVAMQRAPAWTTDWISAQGRESCAPTALRLPGPVDPSVGVPVRFMPRRQPQRALPALPQRAHRAPVGLWLDRLQSALPLPGRARSRSSTSSPSEAINPIFATNFFHERLLYPLRVCAIEPDTAEAVIVSFDVPARAAPRLWFYPRAST